MLSIKELRYWLLKAKLKRVRATLLTNDYYDYLLFDSLIAVTFIVLKLHDYTD